MRRDLLRTIRKTKGRFFAILAIIALGSGFLAGLRCTRSAMMATAQEYVDRQALYDFRVMNTYGYTQEDVNRFKTVPGIRAAEGMTSLDVLVRQPDQEGELAVRLLSVSRDISKCELQIGRMPERLGECLADGYVFSDKDVGKTFLIADTNKESTLDRLAVEKLTVVGICSSPQFLNFERGSTNVGNGSLTAFLYVPQTTFDMDGVYTEVQLKLDRDGEIFSDEYDARLEAMAGVLEPLAQELADHRYDRVRTQAAWDLEDGWAEYEEGLATYEQEKADAEAKLGDARQELEDARKELEDNQALVDSGLEALESGQTLLDQGWKQLLAGEKQLQEQKSSTYTQFAQTEALLNTNLAAAQDGQRQLQGGISQIDGGLAQITAGLAQIDSGLQQLDLGITLADTSLTAARRLLAVVEGSLEANPDDANLLAARDTLLQQIGDLEAQKAELQTQKETVEAQRGPLLAQKEELEAQKAELQASLNEVNEGIAQIQAGKAELESARKQADDSFTAAEAQLAASRIELEQGQQELDENKAKLEQGQKELEEGWAQWEEGKKELEDAEQEADTKLSEAEQKLRDAKKALEDGQKALEEMAPADSFVLDRNTNVAYVCFESDADIVSGVSKIFPLFFFAVAALVCLTTMSKMVDEERTQIGVKKALGYGNLAICGKYLVYSGTAALVGCLVGVSLGSVVFPKIIWQGYQILYNFAPDIKLAADVPLCVLIVAAFTASMLLVTWLCCRRELLNVPAELIRPKAPKAGKRLLLEYLPIWKHLSFLRKVSLRNIFRYRKRLVMMLLGVGGCTALVITGLGLGDTIVDIAETQYSQVTIYDMAVTFGADQDADARELFLENLAGSVTGAKFCHNATVDLSFGTGTKSVNLVGTEESLDGFMDLHMGNEPVAFPGKNQAVINNGLSRALGIQIGDTVTVRNADLEELKLTVTGIFDNAVFNYVIVSQETLAAQWGHEGGVNGALVNAEGTPDIHRVGAAVSDQADVVQVTVSEDMLTRVANMLHSMNYIVVMVIVCAAALAFIVMYNLTNINISERVREIATIKVLGFHSGESAAYVFREGLALTLMGSAVGILAGKYLHAFVIDKIRIDMVYFAPRVDLSSYILSVVLTVLFALAVDFFLYFKLESINMAEALKSVE